MSVGRERVPWPRVKMGGWAEGGEVGDGWGAGLGGEGAAGESLRRLGGGGAAAGGGAADEWARLELARVVTWGWRLSLGERCLGVGGGVCLPCLRGIGRSASVGDVGSVLILGMVR